MKVLLWGREGLLGRGRADGYTPTPDAATLFAQSDVLSLHLRLTAETRGIVTQSRSGPDETGRPVRQH